MQSVGYARVSTIDQNPQLQTDALTAAGCGRIFTDHASGAKEDRPQLAACLDYLRPGDTLVIWKLDRLGRGLKHLLRLADELQSRGIQLVILTMGVDTRTPAGKLLYSLFGAVAEYERELIRERTLAGVAAARARGRKGGRPAAMTPEAIAQARAMYESKQHAVAAIARTFKVSERTIYRNVLERPEGEAQPVAAEHEKGR